MADAFDALLSGAADAPAAGAAPTQGATEPAPAGDAPPGMTYGNDEQSLTIEQESARQLYDAGASAVAGAMKAGFETKDTAVEAAGALGYGDGVSVKSDFRKSVEDAQAQREQQSVLNGLARGITQFGVGFLGLGKVLGPLKWGGKVYNAAKGAAVGAIAFDPHEQRLSNLVQEFPALQNPITDYLAAKPEDTKAEGRLKAAVENLLLPAGVDVGVTGVKVWAGATKYSAEVLTKTVEAIKLRRAGDINGANAAAKEAEEALAKAQKASEKADAQAGQPTAAPDGTPGGGTGGDPATGPTPPGASVLDNAPERVPGAPGDAAGGPGQPQVPGAAGDIAGGADAGGVPKASATLSRVADSEQVRAQQTTKPQVELTPEDTQKLIDKTQRDTGAIYDAGSYEQAVADGHKFANADLIPWQKLGTGNETVDAWMRRVVEGQEEFVNVKRGGGPDGVLTDARVNQMVAARAAVFGEDPAMLRGLILQAGEQARTMAANMEAAYVISQKGMQDTYSLAMRINAGNFAGFESEAAAKAALKGRLQSTLEMFAAAKAMTASAGRTMRRMRGGMMDNADMLQKLNIDAADPDALTKLILSTQGNPKALAQIAKPHFIANLIDYASTMQAANLLWGWGTHVVNLTMNAAALYGRPLMQQAGGSMLQGWAAIRADDALMAAARSARMAARTEMVSTHTFLGDAWQAAKWAFLNADSKLAPHSNEFTSMVAGAAGEGAQRGGVRPAEAILASWREANSLSDVAYNALLSAGDATTLPLRAMGAADEMTKTLRYRAVVAGKADADAVAQGLKPGSKQYKAYMEDRIRKAFDDNGAAIDADALTEAKTTTYSQNLIGAGTEDTWFGWKSAGAALQQGVNSIPPARFILPFIKTPTNLFRYGVKLTPGLNMLQKEYVNAISGAKGAEAQARAVGEMMLGTLLIGTAITLKLDGRVTGGGPVSPKAAKAWKDDGHQPYAFVIPGDGKDKKDEYVSFSRLDPAAYPMGLAADVVDIMLQGHLNEDDERGLVAAVALSLAHQMKNKTYLQNIGKSIEAFTDSDGNKFANFVKGIAPGFLPFSTLLQTGAQIEDPIMRETYGIIDAFKARIPGLSDTMPPHRDAFGEPVMNPGKFYSAQKNPGPLAEALDESYAATGSYMLPPNPRVLGGALDLRDITLENGRNAYDRYQELAGNPTGKMSIRDVLTKLVQTEAYQVMPHGRVSEDGTKEWALEKPMRQFREAALNMLKAESKVFREATMQRQKALQSELQTNIKDLRATKANAATKALNDFLAPTGLAVPVPNAQVPATSE